MYCHAEKKTDSMFYHGKQTENMCYGKSTFLFSFFFKIVGRF